MATTKTMIEQAYTVFNKRDIDGALALMTQDVSWRNIAETAEVDGFLEGSLRDADTADEIAGEVECKSPLLFSLRGKGLLELPPEISGRKRAKLPYRSRL
jgi:hypothetical protein